MTDKVIVITGATSGIGLGYAQFFGKLGAKIVATGRDKGKLRATEELLKKDHIDFITVLADASVDKDNKKMIGAALEAYGKIDILICNAGVSMRALFEEVDMEVFRKVIDINFLGAVYATKYALPHLLKSKGGIIAVSSINGHRGTPARTAYTASKFAMEGFFESLRTEVMKRGVQILVVSPGFTGTNIRKSALRGDGSTQGESPREEEKMMTPLEVAQRTYRAWKKKKRDLVLTTQGKLVVFLNKWFPGKMDNIVYREMAKEPDSPFK